MSETKVPALPAPTQDNLLQVARSIKSMLDVREGLVGNALDANVTFRDLVDSGLANLRSGFTGFNGGQFPVTTTTTGSDGYDPLRDFTPPPKPENVLATGMFATVMIEWDGPKYRNHSYTEIWRSETDVIGNAVLIGVSQGTSYVDNLGGGATRYYWVRHVSQAAVKGPFNATAGLQASTSEDPDYLIQVLSDSYGATSAAPFFQIDQPTVINGVTIPAGTYIKQAFIADATISRAKIQNLAVDDAKIASLSVNKLKGGSIEVGEYIQSYDYVPGQSGWRINGSGAAELGAAAIRGKLSAAQIDSRGLSVFDDAGGVILSTNTKQGINKIAFGGSLFVAVGMNGSTSFSTDGARWPSFAVGTTNYQGVAYDPYSSYFYAVGPSGTIIATSDAKNWYAETVPTQQTLRSVARGPGAMYAVGSGGTLVKKIDGSSSWIAGSSGTSQDLYDIAYTGSTFIAVGANGTIVTSADGVNWASRSSGTYEILTGIAYASGKPIVVVGSGGGIFYSGDGSSWASAPSGAGSALNDVVCNGSRYLAVGNGGLVLKSDNATTWTALTAVTGKNLSGVTWGMSTFIVVGAEGTILFSASGDVLGSASQSSYAGDVSGTVAGTPAPTLVNTANTAKSTADSAAAAASSAQGTANAAYSGLFTKLSNDSRNVLSGPAGIAVGNLTWDSTGLRTGGWGVGFSARGIAAYNSSGNATFVLDGTTGNATFAGALSAATGTFAGTLTAVDGQFTGEIFANKITGDVNKIVSVFADAGGVIIGQGPWITVFTGTLPASSHPDGHVPSAIITVYLLLASGSTGSGVVRLLIDGSEVAVSHTYLNDIATVTVAGSVAKKTGTTSFTVQCVASNESISVGQIRGYLMGVR